jgi:hypothetical protein
VDADPHGSPGRLAAVVAGLAKYLARGPDGVRSVIVPSEAWDEERDDLVADELVDDPVPTNLSTIPSQRSTTRATTP